MSNSSFVQFDNRPLSATSKFAVVIAEERSENMRMETVTSQREKQLNFSGARIIPARVHCQPANIGGVPCEWVVHRRFIKEERVILYLHGGSWMFGNMETARPVGVQITDVTKYRCLMVDYRLAPEHPYPSGLEDCYKVYTYLLKQGLAPEKISIFGDSAGGNLTLALLQKLKENQIPLPTAIGLASPVTDMRLEKSHLGKSKDNLLYVQHENQERDIFSVYLGDKQVELEVLPTVSPILGDLENLPPLCIHAGESEPISLDNIDFAKAYHIAGNYVELKIWREMFHDFSIVGRTLYESVQSMREYGAFFRRYMEEKKE